MPREDQAGLRGRGCCFRREQLQEFSRRYPVSRHGSTLRANAPAEGVAKHRACCFRTGYRRSCDLWVVGRKQVADLFDGQFRTWIGNANSVVEEFAQECLSLEIAHLLSPDGFLI